ncbi:caltractin-like [Nymphaea colorata]|uniref:caltractin-like n=1 Tax=Nymphaea colorata TaxID=210225 RepID=UPI00129DD5F7|nr:caltractin-like [Nymphaea colorata]
MVKWMKAMKERTQKLKRSTKPQPPQPAKPAATASWKDRLNHDDYEDLKNTFEIFDEDHSGSIDPAEINKVLEELGLDKRNPFVLSLIHGLRDVNHPVTFEEFLNIIGTRVGETKTKNGLRAVFAQFDRDENGLIDFEEFKAISKQLHENLNDDDLLEMLHSTHVNQKTASNEGVTFDEFYRIVSKFANK